MSIMNSFINNSVACFFQTNVPDLDDYYLDYLDLDDGDDDDFQVCGGHHDYKHDYDHHEYYHHEYYPDGHDYDLDHFHGHDHHQDFDQERGGSARARELRRSHQGE